MKSNPKSGEPTVAGKILGAIVIAAIVIGFGYWVTNRPKGEPVASSNPPASTEWQAAPAQAEAAPPQASNPQANAQASPAPSAPAVAPAAQASSQSDDPYANLSTKEKK